MQPILRWTGKRYECANSYHIREELKRYGFWFDGESRTWVTEEHKKAVRAIRYANPETRQMLVYLMTT